MKKEPFTNRPLTLTQKEKLSYFVERVERYFPADKKKNVLIEKYRELFSKLGGDNIDKFCEVLAQTDLNSKKCKIALHKELKDFHSDFKQLPEVVLDAMVDDKLFLEKIGEVIDLKSPEGQRYEKQKEFLMNGFKEDKEIDTIRMKEIIENLTAKRIDDLCSYIKNVKKVKNFKLEHVFTKGNERKGLVKEELSSKYHKLFEKLNVELAPKYFADNKDILTKIDEKTIDPNSPEGRNYEVQKKYLLDGIDQEKDRGKYAKLKNFITQASYSMVNKICDTICNSKSKDSLGKALKKLHKDLPENVKVLNVLWVDRNLGLSDHINKNPESVIPEGNEKNEQIDITAIGDITKEEMKRGSMTSDDMDSDVPPPPPENNPPKKEEKKENVKNDPTHNDFSSVEVKENVMIESDAPPPPPPPPILEQNKEPENTASTSNPLEEFKKEKALKKTERKPSIPFSASQSKSSVNPMLQVMINRRIAGNFDADADSDADSDAENSKSHKW